MEMAGKQFFPFMETVVQPCLTACTTASYDLCNCVLRFMEMVGKQFFPFMETVVQPCLTACTTMSYSLYNYVLQLVQLRLTTCVTASYSLWKWLASSSRHLWKRFYKWYERKSAVT